MHPDAIRLLSIQQLHRAKELLATSVSAREAVIRAYNESCGSFQSQDDPSLLHPATDQWILAMHVALGSLHEPEVIGLEPQEALDYAISVQEMLVSSDKLTV